MILLALASEAETSAFATATAVLAPYVIVGLMALAVVAAGWKVIRWVYRIIAS